MLSTARDQQLLGGLGAPAGLDFAGLIAGDARDSP